MDEVLESEAAEHADTGAYTGEPEASDKAYVFDGWGLTPLEL